MLEIPAKPAQNRAASFNMQHPSHIISGAAKRQKVKVGTLPYNAVTKCVVYVII